MHNFARLPCWPKACLDRTACKPHFVVRPLDCIRHERNKKLKSHLPKPKVDAMIEVGYEYACRYCLLSFGYRAFGTAP
jgi:hypothetical protein